LSVRPELAEALAALLEAAEEGPIDLDQFARIIGAAALDNDEIDLLFGDLEARGHEVVAPEGGASSRLKRVLEAARELRGELGRTPRAAEIAERAGMLESDVQIALAFAKMLGKPPGAPAA
jgi:hypothetical protein